MRQSHSIAGRIAAAALVLTGVVAATAVITTELADAADAARRAPRATHLGVPASDFVVLQLIDETTAPKFVRVNSDATRETSEFVVPDERAFVITGYDVVCDWWELFGQDFTTRFWVKNPDTGNRFVILHRDGVSRDQKGSSTVGNGDTCVAHDSLTAGVVLGPGTVLEIDAEALRNSDRGFNSDIYSTYGDYEVTVRGYLTSAD
jgi:hypothetical protein